MHYQVGGSLTSDAPSYIYRQADADLYAALQRGEFCYVLNSRQMGKSSLLVQTRARLQEAGYRCAVVDMTNIGSENISPLQWYKGVVKDLLRGFKLLKQVNFQQWWEEESDVSLLQRLSRLIGDVLLPALPDQNLIIFIDEIDSILSLPFSVDDFFALIRFCYNQRAIDDNYKRISFAIFGVATPSDLIQDRKRTPFNLGTAIALNGFTEIEIEPLIQGLQQSIPSAPAVLKAILTWTNGQPFLTQKLCQAILNSCQTAMSNPLTIPPGAEAYWVDNLVRTQVLKEWESQDEPEHLRTIRNRILNNPVTSGRLLGLYQQVLQSETQLPVDDSPEQIELLLSGLVIKQQSYLRVKNQIYAAVFDKAWVEQQLSALRPYSQLLDAWVDSQRQDESRLLRGQALQEAQQWATEKRLSDLDYQFLSASVEHDRRQVQQALEADRAQAMMAQLQEERRSAKLQRQLLSSVGIALLVALGFGTVTFLQYRQARISEVKALASAAEGNFNSHRQLEAMTQAIAAQTKLQKLTLADADLKNKVQAVLRQVIDGITLRNQLDANFGVQDISVSPDAQTIAVVGLDGNLRLWRANGELIKNWNAHTIAALSVDWTPDGQTIATTSADKTVKLWRPDGTLLKTIALEHPARYLQFSPDGTKLAVTGGKNQAYLFHIDGRLLQQFPQIEQMRFSPNGEFIIATIASPPPLPRYLNQRQEESPPPSRRLNQQREGLPPPRSTPDSQPPRENVQLLRSDGSFVASFATEKGPIFAIAFHPNSQSFATASVDGAVSLWRTDGQLLKTFIGSPVSVRAMAFSPDGSELATASADNTIRLWQTEGSLLKILSGHRAIVRSVKFSSNGQWLVSGSEDGQVKIWHPDHPNWTALASHTDTVNQLLFQPDGTQLLSASVDFRLNIWQQDGKNLSKNHSFNPLPAKTVFTDQLSVSGLAVSRDGQRIAQVFRRGSGVEIRNRAGDFQTLLSSPTSLHDVVFAPQGDGLIAAGNDGSLQRWQLENEQWKTASTSPIAAHTGAIKALAINSQGTLIASGASDRLIKLWDMNGQLRQTLSGHQATIEGLAFSPNGEWLASAASDNSVKLWRPDGQLVHNLLGHSATVLDVDFSPDSKYVASSSVDGTVKIWGMDGRLIRTMMGHNMSVETVAFSPDGQSIASAGFDRRIILWDWQQVHQLNELEFACQWLQDYRKIHQNEETQQICR
jgi:WD40 repeat protein